MPGGVSTHGPAFRVFGDVNAEAAKGHFRALLPRALH